MLGRAIRAFLDKLSDGDPVAIGFVVGFLILAAVAGLVILKVKRDLCREDEARANRYRRPPK